MSLHRLALLLVLAGAAAVPAPAQESPHLVTAGTALDAPTCRELAAQVMNRLESYTRIKFRRRVPVLVEPRASWERRLKLGGVGGVNARQGLAFYDIPNNRITVVPWVIGRYPWDPKDKRKPAMKSRDEWIHKLESIIIHELMHALHHQNFYVVLGGARTASLSPHGGTPEQNEEATVEFLTAEGTAELVSVRTATDAARTYLTRRPQPELSRAARYLKKYQPDGKQPFRVILSAFGYQDGLDVLHQVSLKAGPRGVRALLYRPPPVALFFQPELLAEVDLDDPPDPDSIFNFLAPEVLRGSEIYLAVNPGRARYFRDARSTSTGRERAEGCLVGYAASVGDEEAEGGRGEYSFFVADPDKPGNWSGEQAASLMSDGGTKARKPLPMTKGVDASVITLKAASGAQTVRAEAQGLVVLARETKPTSTLEERTLLALRSLYIRRPKPAVYKAAAAKAKARLEAGGGADDDE